MSFASLVIVFVCGFLFLGWAPPAAADPRLNQVAAAISIADKALEAGDAALLTAAAEMLHATEPGGDDILTRYVQEARFLARGDQTLLARLDALAPVVRDDATLIVTMIPPGQIGVTAPEGASVLGLYPRLPTRDAAITGCTEQARALVSICAPDVFGQYSFETVFYAIFLVQRKVAE